MTANTRAQLIADYDERDQNGLGKFILAAGISPDIAGAMSTLDQLERLVRDFLAGSTEGVHLTLHQLGDSRDFMTLPAHRPLAPRISLNYSASDCRRL